MFTFSLIAIAFVASFAWVPLFEWLDKRNWTTSTNVVLGVGLIAGVYCILTGAQLLIGGEDPLAGADPETVARAGRERFSVGFVILVIRFWPYVLLGFGALSVFNAAPRLWFRFKRGRAP